MGCGRIFSPRIPSTYTGWDGFSDRAPLRPESTPSRRPPASDRPRRGVDRYRSTQYPSRLSPTCGRERDATSGRHETKKAMKHRSAAKPPRRILIARMRPVKHPVPDVPPGQTSYVSSDVRQCRRMTPGIRALRAARDCRQACQADATTASPSTARSCRSAANRRVLPLATRPMAASPCSRTLTIIAIA